MDITADYDATPTITPLSPAEQAEALEVLAQAFAGHPMVPPDPPDKPGRPAHHNARVMMGTMLECFLKAPGARLLGARVDGELACVAFAHDYGYEPGGLDLVRMAWRMLRMMGPRRMLAAMRVMSEKHPGDDRRLELLILGTVAAAQGSGLGRAMLRHVVALAEQGAYAAVTLEAAKDTPAFGFYEREGFVVEKALSLFGQPLCYMRRESSRGVVSAQESPCAAPVG
ncbi:MAG: GNAT family N-acetyltransferase [Planctomycetota bacterium]